MISLDSIDFKEILSDKTLNSTDKVLFVWIAIELISHNKCAATRKRNFELDYDLCSEETGIPKSYIKYSLKKLDRYILSITII